jgi:hypothetical protein
MAMTGGTAKLVAQGKPSGWPSTIDVYVYYKVKSQSIPNNQTVLSLGMYFTTPSGWYLGSWTDYGGSYIGTATSGANCKTFNGSLSSNTQSLYWMAENLDVTVTHDADGSKTATIYWKWGVNSTWGGLVYPSGSFTVKLPTIPRASEFTAIADGTLGEKCSVKWTPKSNTFRYKLKFSLGNWSYTTGVIHPNTTSVYTYTGYTFPYEIANQIPNSSRAEMSVELYSYSDSAASNQIGSDSDKFNITVPDNVSTKPYTTTMSLTPVSSVSETFASLYIQGYTKVKMTSVEEAQFGATIVEKTMTVEGKVYGSAADFTSDFIVGFGNVDVKLTLTDSRGFVNTKTMTISVIPYSPPRVVPMNDTPRVVCARCDANGNLTESGTYLKIKARRSFSLCPVNGRQQNFCGLRYRYRRADVAEYSAWITLLASMNRNTEEIDSSPLLDGSLSAATSYVVQVDAVDSIPNHTSMTFSIPTDSVYMHKAGHINGLAIGKYAEIANTVDIAEDIAVRVRNSINGVFMAIKAVSGTASFDIQTKYSEFVSTGGNERQSFFIFGEDNGTAVYGLATVSNKGTVKWAGTSGVTLSAKAGGILTVTLPGTAYDLFTILSSRKFTV